MDVSLKTYFSIPHISLPHLPALSDAFSTAADIAGTGIILTRVIGDHCLQNISDTLDHLNAPKVMQQIVRNISDRIGITAQHGPGGY